MKNIIAYLIVFTLLFLSAPSYAAADVNGFKVDVVRADKDGKGYVKFEQDLAGSPASCGSGHSAHLAFDLNTPGGRGGMSLALSAKATGASVRVVGTGTCDIYGSVESWSWGFIY